ncbi:TonB-dependent receptor [Sphingomonas oligophenolica]|uniref:TonB-dependent siderophore receptor n=1 Tax=Sphingomonas oligophenolica TaxID=301154 RepID=A0ABU9YBP4_9SPHN
MFASIFLAQGAYAQTVPADAPRSWGEDIVVAARRDGYVIRDSGSATRTPTPLIDVAQSVQVINKSLITDQDRRTLADALVNVSGVVPTKPEESALAQPLVRGFPAEIYLDGLPAFGINALADPTSLTGVERIEVVKGPTGTVYGGGAGAPLGGLINVDSVRPEDKLGGYVAFRAGSFATINPYADLNVPLGGGVAARITGEYQSNKSWIDEVKGYRWSIQPSISFQLGDRTELLLRGKYDRRSQLEYSGLPAAQALAGQVAASAFPGAPIGQPRSVIVNKLITAELRHKFSADLQLTVTGRYYYNKYDEYGSFIYPDFIGADPATPTVYPIFPINLPASVKEATVDANLLANVDTLGGHHELLVGFNYDHTNYDSAFNFDFTPVGLLDLAHPVYDLAFGPALPPLSTQTDTYDTIAGYVQDQATYGRLHLSGSLRYTRFTWHRVENATNVAYHNVSPRVGATFDIVPGAALFAGYATAFRGANQLVAVPGYNVKPETSRSFEGGLKLALGSAHVWGTLAAFELTRRNVPAADPNNFGYSIQTGEQRSRGFEADITWEPSRALSILANYAYTEAKVTRDEDATLVGQTLARVPKHSGRVAAHYRVLNGSAKGLSFGAGVTAFTAREVFLPNTVAVPGYAAVDAQASYDFGRFTVTVSGVNLGGHRGFDTYEYLSPVVIPIQPRSAYVMLKARF